MTKRTKKTPEPEDEEYWIQKLSELELEPDWYDEIIKKYYKANEPTDSDEQEPPVD